MTTETQHRPGPFATGPVAKPLPDSSERDPRYDNQPPLGERIAMDFEEELRSEGLLDRAAELTAAASRAPPCDSEDNCGKIGDFVKQCRTFEQTLEAVREKHNRPLIDARTQLKARTDSIFRPLGDAVAAMRQQLDTFVRAEKKRADEEQRKRDEETRRLREEQASREADIGFGGEPVVEAQARRVEAPVARGDYGSRVGTRVVWCHEIESVRQLPDRLLKHPRVVEVLDKVIAAEIRAASGKCEIKGVKIWADHQAAVR